MVSLETLRVTLHPERYAVLELARPDKFNALNSKAWEEFVQAFNWLDSQPNILAVVIRGQGKNFCAGVDFEVVGSMLSVVQQGCPGRAREVLRRRLLAMQDAFSAIERCRWPVIAAIHGACIGGGIDMITACDIRLCSADASFSIKEVDIGVVADMGTLQRLPSIIGHGAAMELALTARTFQAQEAKSLGLVSQVVSDRQVLFNAADTLAKQIASKSPLAVTGTKRVLLHSRDHSVADGLEYVATWNSAQMASSDLQEIIEARQKRRRPQFSMM